MSLISGTGNTVVSSPKEQSIVRSSKGEPGTYHVVYYSCSLNEVPLFQIPSARSDGGPQCTDPIIKTLRGKLKEEEKTVEGNYWNYI